MDSRNTKATVDIVLDITLRVAAFILLGVMAYKLLSSFLFSI